MGEASAAQLSSGGRSQRVDFNALVLATGNVTSGGLAVEGRDIVDPLGIFQVASSPASGIASRHLLSALSSGMVTRDGKAVTRQGSTLRNVIPVGSLVRGMSYPLGRGLGDVVLQAWKAALVAEDAL